MSILNDVHARQNAYLAANEPEPYPQYQAPTSPKHRRIPLRRTDLPELFDTVSNNEREKEGS